MSHAQRTAVEHTVDPAVRTASRSYYDAGGRIAELQANLARQLLDQDAVRTASNIGPTERLTRMLSRSGGYAALALGYAATGVAILRWL